MSLLATPEPWNLVAGGYVEEALQHFEFFSRAALVAAELPPAPRIIDVAAGPGTLSLMAAAQGASVSAIDFSEGMLQAFRARAAAAGLSGRIDLRQGDGQHLPFDDAAFDGAFSMFGLMFFPDRLAGLRELRRVLRAGRRAVISSWVPGATPFRVLSDAVGQAVPGVQLGGGPMPLSTPDDIRREMIEAGLRDVRVETVPYELTAPSADAFWSSMQRSNAPLVLLRHRLGERWAAVAPAVLDHVRAVLGDGPVSMSRGAYLGIGVA